MSGLAHRLRGSAGYVLLAVATVLAARGVADAAGVPSTASTVTLPLVVAVAALVVAKSGADSGVNRLPWGGGLAVLNLAHFGLMEHSAAGALAYVAIGVGASLAARRLISGTTWL